MILLASCAWDGAARTNRQTIVTEIETCLKIAIRFKYRWVLNRELMLIDEEYSPEKLFFSRVHRTNIECLSLRWFNDATDGLNHPFKFRNFDFHLFAAESGETVIAGAAIFGCYAPFRFHPA